MLKGLGITIQHLFERDITIQYPEEMPFLQERFRGHLYQEFAKCIVCGICVKSCPNNVLSLEEGRDNQSKKKILLTFTIDHQYCMFCNICVENCPANCLHFNHDFELARYNREDIKTVYKRSQEMAGVAIDIPVALDEDKAVGPVLAEKGTETEVASPQEPKESKKNPAEAMFNALLKNPSKLLAKYLPDPEQAAIVAAVLQKDDKKARKVAELMISDKDKAKKVIDAMLKSETKATPASLTATEGSISASRKVKAEGRSDSGDGGEKSEP